MALSTAILRRAASSAVPLVARAIRGEQNHFSIVRPLAQCLQRSISSSSFSLPSSREVGIGVSFSFSSRSFSSSPSKNDAKLLQIIDSEIKCAEESDDHDRENEIPDRFPFEIKDTPGSSTITLTRDYHGEAIKVAVSMPDLVTGEEDDKDDDDDKDDERGGQSSIPLIVNVSKGGDGPALEFCCTAYPDEVVIDSMSVKEGTDTEENLLYEGPDFSDLDENLQKAFHKYLEIRGISPSTTNFLHEYMINKDSREYLLWLKNLKTFVGN